MICLSMNEYGSTTLTPFKDQMPMPLMECSKPQTVLKKLSFFIHIYSFIQLVKMP